MKFVLVALNSSYVHSCLAVRALGQVLRRHGHEVACVELTINDRHPALLRRLWEQQGDAYLFSCYIWNITQTLQLAQDLRQILPGVRIALGGPEVSYRPAQLLELPFIDAVMCGEGEGPIVALAQAWQQGMEPRHPSIATRKHSQAQLAQTAPLEDMPFPYEGDTQLDRIVYYESTRGCPYNCAYCLSSTIRGVRALPLPRVEREIRYLVQHGAKLVKFVDRTFNYDRERARQLWRFLAGLPGDVRFHFEICAHLLDEQTLELLRGVPPDRFQFEIGVQSTCPPTLEAIHRQTDTERCLENIRRLQQMGNIHLHVDLIAGLPYEDLEHFAQSFDAVYPTAQVLQLGFLKVLSGSEMERRRQEYGMVCSAQPPYEVYATRWMTYEQMLLLKDIEELVERYHNSGVFLRSMALLEAQFDSPFACYRTMAQRLREQGFYDRPRSQKNLYEVLYQLGKEWSISPQQWEDAIRQDYILYQGLQNPPFLRREYTPQMRGVIRRFLHHISVQQGREAVRHLACHPFGSRVLLFDEQKKTVADVTDEIERLGTEQKESL